MRYGAFIPALSLSLVVALGPVSPALASDNFRCGAEIIESGMSVDKVKALCGPPTEDTGDRLIYDRGPEELIMVVHIEPDNTVGDIEARSHE